MGPHEPARFPCYPCAPWRRQMNGVNASPRKLQWPEKAYIVEQRRPYHVSCPYTLEISGREVLRWKGRNVTSGHTSGRFRNLEIVIDHRSHRTYPSPSIEIAMVVSAAILTTSLAKKLRPVSLETITIDQSRTRERYRSPTRHRKL